MKSRNYAQSEKLTIEQAARILRYEIFERYSDGCVFLGHNKDDNAETIFMNILRGSGIQGLCGIEKVSNHYYRPLLDYTKKQIMEFNHKNSIEYIIDSSNNSNYYMRNFVRNELFPSINEKTGKDISSNLVSLASLAKQAQTYIDKQIEMEFKKRVTLEEDSALIDILDFITLDEIISSGLLRKAIQHVKKILKDVEKKHIEIIINLINNSQSGSVLELKDGIRVLRLQNDRVRIYKQADKDNNFCENINMEGDTHIDSRGITVQSEISIFEGGAEYSKRWVMLDYEAVREGLVIRNRRVQDFIYPSKGNGKKSLKKYFIDNKIDSDLRDKLFILAIENEIVYIENKEIGKRFRPKKGNKALRLEFI
ncbi:MAG TPA: tRNA lysidine(34) synthetase TilS [Clostridia bacterium]|nr:tRNA lysidine(34) synthetase TilS [Clostridia bacterium]